MDSQNIAYQNGFKDGLQYGERNRNLRIAIKLLGKGETNDVIHEITELDLDTITILRSSLFLNQNNVDKIVEDTIKQK